MASTSRSRNGIIVGVVGAGIGLLLVVAVIFGGSDGSDGRLEFGEPTIKGFALPPMPPSSLQDTSANGLVSPRLAGSDYGDSTVVIGNDGRPKGVVFLAHWCPHCQEEVPRVQAWLDGGGGVEGVDLYSVSTAVDSSRPNYPPSTWLDTEGWTVPLIRDDRTSSAHLAYGGGGFPYWVFTNSDGTVALRTSGQLQTEQLVQILESLN